MSTEGGETKESTVATPDTEDRDGGGQDLVSPSLASNLVSHNKRVSLFRCILSRSGTVSNDFNWREGCNGLSSSCTGGHSKLEDLQTALNASSNNNINIILVLNMVTDTLNSQLQFVEHAITNLGLPVVGVELGNELFNNLNRYIQIYPDGSVYGKVCVQWIAALRNKFPTLRLAVVGTPTRQQSHVRDTTWNDKMFEQVQSSLRPHVDGVVIHQYDTTGLVRRRCVGGGGCSSGKFLKSM